MFVIYVAAVNGTTYVKVLAMAEVTIVEQATVTTNEFVSELTPNALVIRIKTVLL